MASRISSHGRVVFMLWGKPEVEDLVRLEAFVEETVKRHGKIGGVRNFVYGTRWAT